MSALLAGLGVPAVAWIIGGLGLLIASLFTARSIKSSGGADQRAADTQRGLNDVQTGSKARAGVDALGDAALDDKLRQFERK